MDSSLTRAHGLTYLHAKTAQQFQVNNNCKRLFHGLWTARVASTSTMDHGQGAHGLTYLHAKTAQQFQASINCKLVFHGLWTARAASTSTMNYGQRAQQAHRPWTIDYGQRAPARAWTHASPIELPSPAIRKITSERQSKISSKPQPSGFLSIFSPLQPALVWGINRKNVR
jgi:hypothetical protein